LRYAAVPPPNRVLIGAVLVLVVLAAGVAWSSGALTAFGSDPAGSVAPVSDGANASDGEEVRAADAADAEDAAEREAATERIAEEAAEAERDAEAERQEESERQAEEERRAEEEAERQAEEERRAEEEAERQAEEERRAEEEAQRRAEEEARERAEEARRELVGAQERLADLGYLIGPADGDQGQQTTAALMAFQAVNGIQVDGVLGPQTTQTLAAPLAEPQLGGGSATRIEVDLDRQILHLVEDGTRTVTFKTSSGNGERYERGDGSTGVANTPVGEFVIERRIEGVRESSAGLGTLFDPMYFLRGFAIHGSNSVPAGPASHGCVRLSRADAVWLFDRVGNGTPVHLYGGDHTFTV
jgi:lipoprotein-anchoring transpeptidase ErfK/SrfK